MSAVTKASVTGVVLSVALLGAESSQAAAPPSVYLRVEGAGTTLLAQTLVPTTATSTVKGKLCSGTSAAGALNAGTGGNWSGSYDAKFKDYLVGAILGETPTGGNFWTLWVNGRSSSTGACATPLHPGDRELWFDCVADASFNCTNDPLALKLPPAVEFGHAVSGSVLQLDGAGHGKPVTGAAVSGGGLSAVSSAHGTVNFVAHRAGLIELQARKSGVTPSDPVQICVYRHKRSECARSGPAVSIAGIREHQRFQKGPRRLHGTAGPDPAGITDVSLRLSRHASAGSCSYFDAGLGRWHSSGCSAAVPSFSVGASSSWSYLLPAPLAVGHYRLVVTATDGSGRRGAAARNFTVKR